MEKEVYEQSYRKLVQAIDEDKFIHKDWQDAAKLELQDLDAHLEAGMSRRLAIIGKRGAGKSSLINAILGGEQAAVTDAQGPNGAAVVGRFNDCKRNLVYLDCIGGRQMDKGDSSVPEWIPKNLSLLRYEPLDLLLFSIEAKELHKANKETEKWTGNIRLFDSERMKQQKGAIPLVIVVTKCDEHNNDAGKAYKEDVVAIQGLIQKAKDAVSEKLPHLKLLDVVATVTKDCMHPWNVDKLIEALIQATSVRVRRSLIAHKVARRMAQKIADDLYNMAYIPSLFYPTATAYMQRHREQLVHLIQHLSQFDPPKQHVAPLSPHDFTEVLEVNYGGWGGISQSVASFLLRAIPIVGGAISGQLAWRQTLALGIAAIVHYVNGQDPSTAKKAFEEYS